MMGINNDRDIAKFILYNPDDNSSISVGIWNALYEAFDKYPTNFVDIAKSRDQ